MCSARNNDLVENEELPDRVAAESDGLHANLSFCLHAMGQPLTILRGAMMASTVLKLPAEKKQEYLATSAQQVELLCRQFDCLRDLVDSSRSNGERSQMKLSLCLSQVIEDQMPVLRALGLAIDLTMPDALRSIVLADVNRAFKALSSVLKIAASVSSRGDVIRVRAAFKSGRVELAVENERSHSRSFTPLERIYLAVAQVNLRGHDGDCVCVEDPFRVLLIVPVHKTAHNQVVEIAKGMGKNARQGALAVQPYS